MKHPNNFLKFIILLLLLCSCGKESFFDTETNPIEKPSIELVQVQSSVNADDIFCNSGGAKAIHSGLIQKNFDCIDTLFFYIERWSRFANRGYQINEISKGIEIAKGFTNRDFSVKFTEKKDKANIIFVWGKDGDFVPPNNLLMPESIGAAYFPTDSEFNGYIYIQDYFTFTSPKSLLHKVIAHEVGHWLGFEHEFNGFSCMNPDIKLVSIPTQEETALGSSFYPVEDCQ